MARGTPWLPAFVVLLSLGSSGASADQTVLTSRDPYWRVGARDEALSRACALGRFGPDHSAPMSARFIGKEGAATLTVARGTGVNLYDPDRRAKRPEDYYFLNSGTTSCEVFVGRGRGGVSSFR